MLCALGACPGRPWGSRAWCQWGDWAAPRPCSHASPPFVPCPLMRPSLLLRTTPAGDRRLPGARPSNRPLPLTPSHLPAHLLALSRFTHLPARLPCPFLSHTPPRAPPLPLPAPQNDRLVIDGCLAALQHNNKRSHVASERLASAFRELQDVSGWRGAAARRGGRGSVRHAQDVLQCRRASAPRVNPLVSLERCLRAPRSLAAAGKARG